MSFTDFQRHKCMSKVLKKKKKNFAPISFQNQHLDRFPSSILSLFKVNRKKGGKMNSSLKSSHHQGFSVFQKRKKEEKGLESHLFLKSTYRSAPGQTVR